MGYHPSFAFLYHREVLNTPQFESHSITFFSILWEEGFLSDNAIIISFICFGCCLFFFSLVLFNGPTFFSISWEEGFLADNEIISFICFGWCLVLIIFEYATSMFCSEFGFRSVLSDGGQFIFITHLFSGTELANNSVGTSTLLATSLSCPLINM